MKIRQSSFVIKVAQRFWPGGSVRLRNQFGGRVCRTAGSGPVRDIAMGSREAGSTEGRSRISGSRSNADLYSWYPARSAM